MLVDFFFILYIVLFVLVCLCAFTKTGQKLQWEFFAWRDTKRFYESEGIKWPDI